MPDVSDLAYLDAQRELLAELARTHRQRATTIEAEAAQLTESGLGADARFDEEGGDGDVTEAARTNLLQVARSEADAADAAEVARLRIEDGTYESCESCGKPIGRERLEAMPTATLCVTCKAGRRF